MEVGDLVKITETGYMYTSYTHWLEVRAKEYVEEYKRTEHWKAVKGMSGKIIAKGYHRFYKKRKIYLIETEVGPILIGKKGVKTCEKQ
jgi:hypothetical protein